MRECSTEEASGGQREVVKDRLLESARVKACGYRIVVKASLSDK
jgi:DNA-directed RNA polymerase subunit RPC12/RpoP